MNMLRTECVGPVLLIVALSEGGGGGASGGVFRVFHSQAVHCMRE